MNLILGLKKISNGHDPHWVRYWVIKTGFERGECKETVICDFQIYSVDSQPV